MSINNDSNFDPVLGCDSFRDRDVLGSLNRKHNRIALDDCRGGVGVVDAEYDFDVLDGCDVVVFEVG